MPCPAFRWVKVRTSDGDSPGQLVAHGGAVIRGAVVHQKQLIVCKRLRKYGFNAAVQIGLHIVYRNDYADFRHGNPSFWYSKNQRDTAQDAAASLETGAGGALQLSDRLG